MGTWYPLGNNDSFKLVKVGRGMEKVASYVYSDEKFANLVRAFKGQVPDTTLTCLIMRKPICLSEFPQVKCVKEFRFLLDAEKVRECKDFSKAKTSYAYDAYGLRSFELAEPMHEDELLELLKSYVGSSEDYMIVGFYSPQAPDKWFLGESDGNGQVKITPISASKS